MVIRWLLAALNRSSRSNVHPWKSRIKKRNGRQYRLNRHGGQTARNSENNITISKARRRRLRYRTAQLPPAPSCPVGFVYTIQAGESLERIARRFNVTLDDLLRANPQIEDPHLVFIGQSICIPFFDPDCRSGLIIEIAEGDTLYTIAQQFGVTVEQLFEVNPQITNPNNLLPGQRICLPEGAELKR